MAPPGRFITDEGLDRIIESTVEEIEQRMPGNEYRLVELAEPGHFNFVWVSGPTEPEIIPEVAAANA